MSVVAIGSGEGVAHIFFELSGIHFFASYADHAERGIEILTFDKIVEGGDEFDLGEVASDAEDDERKVVHEPQFSTQVGTGCRHIVEISSFECAKIVVSMEKN